MTTRFTAAAARFGLAPSPQAAVCWDGSFLCFEGDDPVSSSRKSALFRARLLMLDVAIALTAKRAKSN